MAPFDVHKHPKFRPMRGGKAAAGAKTAPSSSSAPHSGPTTPMSERYLIKPTSGWHAVDAATQPGAALTSSSRANRVSTGGRRDVNSMLLRGMDLLKDEGKRFSSDKSYTGGDASFMRTILTGGTLSDRVSALTLLVQSSPLHNLTALEQLFNLARKKNRRYVLLAVDSLKDLLTGGGLSAGTSEGLLPSDRKLRFFIDSLATLPDSRDPTDAELVLFAFEDRLKRLVFDFLGILERLSHDTLPYIRSKTTTAFLDMLVAKPEQEHNLLKLLVNKLGDAERKLAAKAAFLIHQLTTTHHPAMKPIVVRSVEEFMLRSHVGDRAHYYAVITLNQMLLSHEEADVAVMLVDTYFGFFHKLAADAKQGKSTIDHKILSGLLTGVNRAFPYAKEALLAADAADAAGRIEVGKKQPHPKGAATPAAELAAPSALSGTPSTLTKHLDTLFKITHYDHFTVRVQALSLIYQVMQSKPDVVSRFYRSLYAALLDHRGTVSSKQLALFLNLVFRAMRSDSMADRVVAFAKRLLQLALNDRHAGVVIGSLWIVSKVMTSRAALVPAMLRVPEEASAKPYDAFHRTPEYAHAGTTGLWELNMLANHFHPSVQVFAQAMLRGEPLALPEGVDPLETYTMTKFLDKFVYKKPKKSVKSAAAGGTAAASMLHSKRIGFIASEGDHGKKRDNGPANVMVVGAGRPLNSTAFANMHLNEVAADEVFFHRFFTKQQELHPKKAGPTKSMRDDFDNVDEEAEYDMSAMDGPDPEDDNDSDMGEDAIQDAIFKSAGFSKKHDPGADDSEDEDDEDLAAYAQGMDSDDADEGGDDEDDEAAYDMVEDGGNESDLEAAFADDMDAMDSDMGDDAGGFEDDDDGYVGSDDETMSRRKKKKMAKDKTKLGYTISGSVFASADEFSRMLESNEGLDSDDDFGELVPSSAVGGGKKRKRGPSGGGSRGGGGGGSRGGKRRRH